MCIRDRPGAADDGYSIACMIETVKLLKDQPRKNDIQLIITDGEEMGLLGAFLHIEQHAMDDVGVLLNYEARGNEGPCIAFEWSDDNAWLVREMQKSAVRPITSSLSYEIYNLMPNSSDFTAFKKRNVPGINHAFIDGFSYYHNPVDNIENLSIESVQHTGENMYLMAKHFANYDFSKTETGNASFFNFYGFLIRYPSSIDLFLLIFLGLFLCLLVGLGLKKKEFEWKKFFKSLLLMIGTLVLICAANFGLATILTKVYPKYATFYSFHYYNHEWYLIAGLGLNLLVLYLVSGKLTATKNRMEVGISILLLLTLLSVALFIKMPTGAYVTMLPALFLAFCIMMLTTRGAVANSVLSNILLFGFTFLIAGMWSFLSHNLFLAFSLYALPGAVLFMILSGYALMYLAPQFWKKSGKVSVVIGVGLLLFLGGLLVAHIEQSQPTESEPLLTNLMYVHDVDSDKSYISTFDNHLHKGHQALLEDNQAKRLPRPLPYSTYYKETALDLSQYKSDVSEDLTTATPYDYVLKHPQKANVAYIDILNYKNVDSLIINKRVKENLSQRGRRYRISLYGIGLDSMHVRVVPKDSSAQIPVYIGVEYGVLPEELTLPDGSVWNDPVTYVSHKILIGE